MHRPTVTCVISERPGLDLPSALEGYAMNGSAARLSSSHEVVARSPAPQRVLDRLKRHTGPVSVTRDLPSSERRSPVHHPVRDTWITVASALLVLSVLGVQDWQAVRHERYFHQYLVVDAVAGLVLTPLLVATFLTLRSCTAWLLAQLHRNQVIDPALDGADLERFAGRLDRRLDRLARPTAIATVLYLGYTLADGLDELHGWVAAPPFAAALAVQGTLFFLGVLTVLQIWTVCWAFGWLVRQPNVRVWPLHPDGCGGLWPLGHVLSFVLYFAAILGGASICIFLALPGTPSALTRRPEPYLLAFFYALLLPSALINVLWRPHQLLVEWREGLLTPLARAFNGAIGAAGSAAAADPGRRRATTDLLSDISRRNQVLDDACAAWPVPVRRLRPMVATAILPVVIPVVTTIITKLFMAA
jgi:hypothetical protein